MHVNDAQADRKIDAQWPHKELRAGESELWRQRVHHIHQPVAKADIARRVHCHVLDLKS